MLYACSNAIPSGLPKTDAAWTGPFVLMVVLELFVEVSFDRI